MTAYCTSGSQAAGASGRSPRMSVSVVIPIFNEQENVRPLYESLLRVLPELDRPYELVFVDDGSTDESPAELWALAAADDLVRVVEFRRNFGQTAAISAGIRAAGGDVLITLDGDLQNDPADIPRLLEKIDEGYDLVHGWRRARQDPFFSRTLPSRIANWVISRVTGSPVHDLGCTLKAVRREIAQELELYGEMHRFIPILAHQRGARCTEVLTRHRPRQRGLSKYGISRVPRVLLDLITVKYLIHFLISPMRLFGGIGMICGGMGIVSAGAAAAMKMLRGIDMTGNPLLLLSVLFSIVGVQFLGLGMLGELGTRIYYRVQDRQPYAVRRATNFGSDLRERPAAFENSAPPANERRAA